MPPAPGTRLGPYEILAQIGAGGMGEVWKARDTRLDRTVAIKVSKENFSERFEREARAIAALNHPHICQLYDVGPDYLVMEYVEGSPLKGPLAEAKAVEYAGQVLSALDAAHRKGITHRDLKPGNILVTKQGIKLLDFGLARIAAGSGDETVTMAVMGTPAYMSPEQWEGKPGDARSDIYAFGCVLYEMLTGKRAMPEGRPPVKSPPLEGIIATSMKTDPDERWQSARDIREVMMLPPPVAPKPSRAWPWVAAAAIVVLAVVSLRLALQRQPSVVEKTSARFTIPLPSGQELTSYPAITRDGRTIAYVTQQGTDDSQLYLRDSNAFEARAVPGSSGARQPFFSPDGKWVAFFAQGQLQKAEVAGGAPVRVAEAADPWGGTWNEDNTIVYAVSLGSGLLRIPATGGAPESLTKPDGAAKGYAHVFPQILPGGRSVLFTIFGQTQGGAVLSLDSGQWNPVLPLTTFAAGIFNSSSGPMGHLLVADLDAGVRAARFDAAHPARTTADASVLANVFYDLENESKSWLAVADTGTAVYAAGNPGKVSLVWVDREGKIESLGKDRDVYREARLSPDGSKAVIRHGFDLWIHDFARGTRSRLTSGNGFSNLPLWSRDGTRIIFASNRGGRLGHLLSIC